MDQKFEFTGQNDVPFDIDDRRAAVRPLQAEHRRRASRPRSSTSCPRRRSNTRPTGRTATLASSYQEFSQTAVLDLTRFFGPLVDAQVGAPPGTNTVPLDSQISTDRWAHEFRLTSANNEHLEWLVGLYYTKEESSNFQGAVAQPSGFNLVTQQFPSDYEEKAAFGNVTYYFTPKLDATVGMRLQQQRHVACCSPAPASSPARALPEQTVSDDVQTYLFNARYRPNDDVSLYVRAANGYRPGFREPAADRSGDRRRALGAVRQGGHAVELRGRREGQPRRRRCSATTSPSICIKWEDLQVFRSFMGVNVGGNADSDVTANGVEATLTYQPSSAFNLAATFAYAQQRARRRRSVARRPGRRAAAGHSGVDVLAVRQLRLHARLARRVRRRRRRVPGSAQHVVQRRHRRGGVVIAPANPNFTTDDYVTADLRTGVTLGRYKLSLYATNLFDEYAFQRATTSRHARHGDDPADPARSASCSRGVLRGAAA